MGISGITKSRWWGREEAMILGAVRSLQQKVERGEFAEDQRDERDRESSGGRCSADHRSPTGNPPYSISPYSAVKRYSGKGDTTLHDAPPLRSAGRISTGAGRRYHLVAVPPLDLGAMLTADRP
jgi:hypothetical protein